MALSTNLLFLDELASENHLHAIAIIIMMTRLRGHYVADIRSGICDPNARPTIVKETAGEQKYWNNQDCHHVKIKSNKKCLEFIFVIRYCPHRREQQSGGSGWELCYGGGHRQG